MSTQRRMAVAVTCLAVFLTSCMPGPNPIGISHGQPAAGFWLGLWHGLILLISWIASIFSDHVNVYEVRNNGGWYNFGFALGTGGLLTFIRGFLGGFASPAGEPQPTTAP